MRNTSAPLAAGYLCVKSQPVFHVVLAYDKYTSGIRAKEFFDRLVFSYGGLFHFTCHIWKLDVLREPQLFEAATQDALGADMIVFVARQNQALPVEARRWIDRWLPSKQADSGALVLLPGDERRHVGENATGYATLRQMAEGANVRVFWKDAARLASDSHSGVQNTKTASGGTMETSAMPGSYAWDSVRQADQIPGEKCVAPR